jgi:hypothetical protein
VSELKAFPKSYTHLIATNAIDLQFYDSAKQLFYESSQDLFLSYVSSLTGDSSTTTTTSSSSSSSSAVVPVKLSDSEASDLFELLSLKKQENKQFSMNMMKKTDTIVMEKKSGPIVSSFQSAKNGYLGLAASPQASTYNVKLLGSVEKDISGFGGHTDICKGV